MTDYRHSAERFARMEAAAARRALVRIGAKRLAIAGVLVFAFCAGESHERDRAAAATRRQLADSSKILEKRIDARAPAVQQTVQRATIAQAKHDTAARAFDAHVRILTDSTVSIDSGPPITAIPAALAIPEIQTARSALEETKLALTVTTAQLLDVSDDRNVWRTRSQLDEKHSRFCFKSGVAAGVALAAAVVKVLR